MSRGPFLPKFGEWDEKNPAAAEGFTVIFDRARDNKKNGGGTGTPNNVIPQQNQNQYQNKKHEAAKKNHEHKYPRKQVCLVKFCFVLHPSSSLYREKSLTTTTAHMRN